MVEKVNYTQEVLVIDIKVDVPMPGKEFIQVIFGYEMGKSQGGAPTYKHLLHLFIPKSEWHNQYALWDKYTAVIGNDGTINVKRNKDGN